MTLVEARARAKQLNAQAMLKTQEERIKKMEEEQMRTQMKYNSVLPSEFVAEFEQRFIRNRDSLTEIGARKTTRAFVIWRAAQRMMVTVPADPSEWFYHTPKFYDYFYERKVSPRYISSILKIANLWGFFFSRKLVRPFLPIPPPRGFERQRLVDAFFEKTRGVSRASKPVSPADLNRIKNKLNRNNFNWVFLSVWFGLRPKEVDSLKEKEYRRIEILPNGRKILWIYQTKIIALPPEDRWKPIPILFQEQHFALKIIELGNFQRPLIKTMRRLFGPGVSLYGGRKGFSDLMLSKNQTFENISIWMGHSSLQRTWQSYKQRRKFHLVGY